MNIALLPPSPRVVKIDDTAAKTYTTVSLVGDRLDISYRDFVVPGRSDVTLSLDALEAAITLLKANA